MTEETEGPVRPGRRRSEKSRRAILAAAAELTGEVGYAGLTIEGIAARSGTGKQTIYRWWRSKADVLLDVLTAKAELHIPLTDHGSYAADLRRFLSDTFALADTPQLLDVLQALMAEAQVDREFRERFRASFLQHRRDALRVVLDRAHARGDLPPVPRPDTVVDIVFGILWYRVLTDYGHFDQQLADELVATLAPTQEVT